MEKEKYPFKAYHTPELSDAELRARAASFYKSMSTRRSCRHFSSRPIPKEVIENLIKVAGTAPSGAHKQPWVFCAISAPEIKSKIRQAAEKEEKEFYENRATKEWLEDLAPLGTDWNKEFLETAPWLIAVFRKLYDDGPNGRYKNYYVQESVGIASGFLISAIHQAGLTTLTHTPSPMNFLSEILERPANEKPFLLLPVGFAAEDARVPDLQRKELHEVAVFVEGKTTATDYSD